MANITAGDRSKAPYAGDLGNTARWSGYHKMPVAGGIGDTIELAEIPAGALVSDVSCVWSAHGGTATLALGWKYKDGSAGGSASAFKAAASSVAAGNSVAGILPVYFDKPAILYATNAGSAIPQNGEVSAVLYGEFVGTK